VFRRRVLGVVLAGTLLAVAGGVIASRSDLTGAGVGVAASLAVMTAAASASFLGCIAEFALASRPRFTRWVRLLPVDTRTIAVVTRVPVFATGGAVMLAVGVPVASIIGSSTDHGPLHATVVTIAAISLGACAAPVLVVAAQWVVIRTRRGGFYGGALITAWLAWSASAGVVFRAVLRDGAEAVLGPQVAWLGWPAALDFALLPSVGSGALLAAVTTAWAAIALVCLGRLRTLDEIATHDLVRTERELARHPLTAAVIVRCWRNRQTRAHLVATAVFALAAVAHRRIDPNGADPRGAAFILALFAGGFGSAARSMSGPLPLEVRLLCGPERYVAALNAAALAHSACYLLAAGAAFAAVTGDPGVAVTAVVAGLAATAIGVAVGCVLAPRPGDPAVEVLATACVVGVLVAAGHVADQVFGPESGPYLATLTAVAAFAVPLGAHRERRRWTTALAGAGAATEPSPRGDTRAVRS
jgi:hypothetical protein